MKIRLAALVTICAAALLWYTEQLKSEDLARVCAGSKESRTDVIKACTSLIESESTPSKDRQLYLTRRAWVYYCDKQYDKAIVDADQVLSGQPMNADLLVKRATFKQANGDLVGASEDFERAREVAQNSSYVHFSLGKFHEKQGKSPLAAASYQRVLEIDPGHQDAFKKIVNYLFSQGNFSDVRQMLADARARWPHSEWVYEYSLLLLITVDHDAQKALRIAELYKTRLPEAHDAFMYLGVIQFGTGDQAAGIETAYAFAKQRIEKGYAEMSFVEKWTQKFANRLFIGRDLQWLDRTIYYAALGQTGLAEEEIQAYLTTSGKNGREVLLSLFRGREIPVDKRADAGSQEHLNQAISSFVTQIYSNVDLSRFRPALQIPEH